MGKNVKTWLPQTEKNKLTTPENVNEEIHLDFLGPLISEKVKVRFILVAIDNCSKWIWTNFTKSCSSKAGIKLLNRIIGDNGLSKSIKTDNATAFKSGEFKKFTAANPISHKLSTLYVYTPIGTVERNRRTLENHIKTYLIEKNNLRKAVDRAIRLRRFTVSKSTGATPFEIHFGRKPRSIFDNLLDLNNESRGIIENIYDLNGNHSAQNQFEQEAIKKMVFNRSYGKSALGTDIVKELHKRKVRPNIQFF